MFGSVLHIGNMSDVEMWRQFSPAMSDEEYFLADKAYIGVDGCVPPRKKPSRGRLSQTDEDYNIVHRYTSFSHSIRWFRATIEHVFGQMKRFRVLSGLWRCKLTSMDFLNDLVTIVAGILII